MRAAISFLNPIKELMPITWVINVVDGQSNGKVQVEKSHLVGFLRTIILDAIKSTVDTATIVIHLENQDSGYIKSNNFNYAIVLVGETPYVETDGDNFNLTIPEPGPTTIKIVCANVKCVVVVVSGRPIVIEPYVEYMDALVAAWLPGSEGKGVSDVLFGDFGFVGKLSRAWFKNVGQLSMNVGDSHYDPLFPFGFGLRTKGVMEN